MGRVNNYVLAIKDLKEDGIKKQEALACLEFDSDDYPNPIELKQALEIVYGKDSQ